MSLNTLSETESQSLLAAGYTNDLIDSLREYYQKHAFDLQLAKNDLSDCEHSSMIQYVKDQNDWNPSQVHTFYRDIRKAMKMKPTLDSTRLSLCLAQSASSESEFSSSMPIFIDDNSISASFPSIIVSAISAHRKPKYVTITAPCSPITEAYSLEYMNQYTSNVTDVDDHVMDMVSATQTNSSVEAREDIFSPTQTNTEIAKEIVFDIIRTIEHAYMDKQPQTDQRVYDTLHGNEQTVEQKQCDDVQTPNPYESGSACSIPHEVLCIDAEDDSETIWSSDEQNGFIYIDDDAVHESDDDITVSTDNRQVQIQSAMRGIVLDIVHTIDGSAICFDDTIKKSETIQDEMKGIIFAIIGGIEDNSKSEWIHSSDATAVVSECKLRDESDDDMALESAPDETDNALIIDRPLQVKEEQMAQKEETVGGMEVHKRLSLTEQCHYKSETMVVNKRLSLTEQCHYKSETMVIKPRYSILVNDVPQTMAKQTHTETLKEAEEEEEEEEEAKEEEEEEEEEEINDEIYVLSDTEMKLFGPPPENKKKVEAKKRTSSFFVHIESEKRLKQRPIITLKDINENPTKEDEDEELPVDPFAIYREFPADPAQSIQVQRIAYLLSQYQSLNEMKKACHAPLNPQHSCVVWFICNGSIDDGYYTVERLLNDWYYILVHYCASDALFDELTQYIASQMCACDVLQCSFIKRNYKQYISSNSDVYYYEETHHEAQTRIRLLDRIHCHLFHSYDFGFKLHPNERAYVKDEASDGQSVDKNERHLKDKRLLRLKRRLNDKIKVLKRVVGPKRRSVNKFVTQMFHAGSYSHSNMTSSYALTVPKDLTTSTHIKRPTKIEINDNYQFGQKFYYWEYHRKAGWKWYIHARYKSLKQELISNKLVTPEQFEMYYHEALHIAQTFIAKSYVACIDKYFGNYFYGIRAEDALSVRHILAVLLFSNDYKLQIKLNASYTKRSEHESDTALKQRHSYFVHWARLLCETVEIFVNTQFYARITDFYHNTNCRMYFNDVYASLYTPTSMTRSLQVATCYANAKGLLLHFELADEGKRFDISNNHYFECNWISTWSAESEILFVGAAAPLKFKSVIQWQLSYNYQHYISAIGMTQKMLHGDPLSEEESISQPIMEAITDLITRQLNREKRKKYEFDAHAIGRHSASVNIADFIYECFNHFVQNTTYHIQFDLYKMNFDYFEMRKFFFTKNGDWLKFEPLFTLFPNVRYLTIVPGWSAEDCALKLTTQRMFDLFSILKESNSGLLLERISIDQPNTMQLSLKQVMTDFKPMYAKIGWNIDCCGWKKYDDSEPQLIIVKHISD